jgi:TATA-binding protein-associated factor Taf7
MNHNLQREQRNQQQQQQYNRGGPLHPGGEGGERINRDAQRRVDQPPQQHHRDNENRLPQRENDLINLHAERINRDDVVNEVHENVEMDVEDDDDDDEEEEDDEDEDDEDEDDEDDEDEENGNNSAIEGGVVMGEEGKNQLATSCNMVSFQIQKNVKN